MGVRLINILGTNYNPGEILYVEEMHEADSNKGWILQLGSSDPKKWKLAGAYEVSVYVYFKNNDIAPHKIAVREAIPEETRLAFEKIRATPLPKFFGRESALDDMREHADALLEDLDVPSVYTRLTSQLADARQAAIDEIDAMLDSLPAFRLVLPDGEVKLIIVNE